MSRRSPFSRPERWCGDATPRARSAPLFAMLGAAVVTGLAIGCATPPPPPTLTTPPPPAAVAASASVEAPDPPPPPEGVAPGTLAAFPPSPRPAMVRRAPVGGTSPEMFAMSLDRLPAPDGHLRSDVAVGRALVVMEVRGLAASSDGEITGLARITAEAWFADRFLARSKLAVRGGDAWLVHGFDSVRVVIAVPPTGLEATLVELRAAVATPTISSPAFARAVAAERARWTVGFDADDALVAEQLLHRRLFELPVSLHPFASLVPTEAELDRVAGSSREAAALLRAHLDTGNICVVLATPTRAIGTAELDTALERAARAFSPAARAGVPPRPRREPSSLSSLTTPFPPGDVRIALADRATSASMPPPPRDSAHVAVRLSFLGPARSSAVFGSWLVAAPLIELALRGDPRVGPETRVRVRRDVPRGAVPIEIAFFAPQDRAARAIEAAREVIARVVSAAPSAADLADAKRAAMRGLARPAPTPDGTPLPPGVEAAFVLLDDRAVADEAERDELEKRVAAAQPAGLAVDLTPLFDVPPVIVVVGDGATAGPGLAKTFDVDVFDPKRNFARSQSFLKRAEP